MACSKCGKQKAVFDLVNIVELKGKESKKDDWVIMGCESLCKKCSLELKGFYEDWNIKNFQRDISEISIEKLRKMRKMAYFLKNL